MLRHVTYAVFLTGFAVFAWHGLQGWAKPPAARTSAAESRDEVPLLVASMSHDKQHMEARRGYPWQGQGEKAQVLKRELPPDVGDPTAEEARKDIESQLPTWPMPMPEGTLKWPQILDRLRKGFEPLGVDVKTGNPPVSDEFELYFPKRPANEPWTANPVLFHIHFASQKLISYRVTPEGILIGTDEAVNRLAADTEARWIRPRVEHEHDDPRLNAEFTPDMVDASVRAFSGSVLAQTGVEVVFDPGIWELGLMFKWRGEPRRLRDALDQMTKQFRWFWRYQQGRVYVLKPLL
jgi:hypothetical protein